MGCAVSAPPRRFDGNERKVIAALLHGDDTEGVIGRRAGFGVRTLPSAIYAAALLRYGIRTGDDDIPGRRVTSGPCGPHAGRPTR